MSETPYAKNGPKLGLSLNDEPETEADELEAEIVAEPKQTKKAPAKPARKTRPTVEVDPDALSAMDQSLLPIGVQIGEMVGSLKMHAGRVQASFSINGWVGPDPLTISPAQVADLQKVIQTMIAQALPKGN